MRTIFELRKAEEREHILVGYQIALDHLDNVIRVIRGQRQPRRSQGKLFKYFSEQDVHPSTRKTASPKSSKA